MEALNERNIMNRVFIGYDQVEAGAFYTLCHSIWRRASMPVLITPLRVDQLRNMGFYRERHPLQSNEFSFTRFMVPWLCNYEGTAVFMDCDMLVREDINELFALADPECAVQVVKHKHVPPEDTKYLGATQTKYERKNWSSVMLFNNEKCRQLTPEYVSTAEGLDLHQFKWLPDERIGELPKRWNYLVDYYPTIPVEEISNLHYTTGGPYFREYADCSYNREWWDENFHLNNIAQRGE